MCILKIDFMLWVLVEFKIKKLSDEFQIMFSKEIFVLVVLILGGGGNQMIFLPTTLVWFFKQSECYCIVSLLLFSRYWGTSVFSCTGWLLLLDTEGGGFSVTCLKEGNFWSLKIFWKSCNCSHQGGTNWDYS